MPTGVAAMTAIGSVVLSSTATDITFTIPSGYRDLRFVVNFIPTTNTDSMKFQINGDTGSNYSWVYAEGYAGDGTTSGASSGTSLPTLYTTGSPSGQPAPILLDIFDYEQTDKHKTVLMRTNAGTNEITMAAGRWASTTAVTSVKFFTAIPSTFASGSTISCYGVSA